MKMNVWRRHSVVLLLGLFVGALACAALIYSTLWARYNNALQQLEPRSERLEGVGNAGAQNDIQQKLRQMIMASGATLVSSQVALEPGVDGKLARIRLTATVNGEWVKLVSFMESLQTHRPPFWVRTANITREGASSGAGPQNARLSLQLEAPLAPEKAKP